MKIARRNNSYTCKVYDKVNKKEVRFTAKTCQELLQKVNKFNAVGSPKMTLGQALDSYISLKEKVLSPSTIRGYTISRKAYEPYENVPLSAISKVFVQEIVNSWINEISPKTIKNRYSLLKSALKLYNVQVDVTLPQSIKPQLVNPSEEHINALLEYFKDTPMECAILLAIYVPMRRGEISALKWEDLDGNLVKINKTFTVDKNNKKILKNSPKTYAGFRTVEIPLMVVEKLNKLPKDTEYVINLYPKQITGRFHRAVVKLGLPEIRFHDLRHFSASYFHSLGIPDKYIIKRGGWESEAIMKRIYQDTIDEKEKEVNEIINSSVF